MNADDACCHFGRVLQCRLLAPIVLKVEGANNVNDAQHP
jgi:hypothetical protein